MKDKKEVKVDGSENKKIITEDVPEGHIRIKLIKDHGNCKKGCISVRDKNSANTLINAGFAKAI